MKAALVALALCLSCSALAQEGRYALMIGANQGDAIEPRLRYAVEDARRLSSVLTSMGGFLPENVVVLQEPTPDRVRDALARLNARLRSEQPRTSSSVLMVFYSGHADALALHLGGAHLPWTELKNLTIGSSAAMRLLVIDACRSGVATRVKGTALEAPFALPEASSAQTLPEGFAILSSATAQESAQESDALQGSFFTHHLIAALRGTADSNDDGQITLAEAYQYTADRTVASTAATLGGVQHPTYLFELKGRSGLVLTRPGDARGLGALRLQTPGQYFLRAGGPQGALALEANVSKRRTVHLRPGRYFLQRRTPRRLYEGEVEIIEGKTRTPGALAAVEYARLVRKGGQKLALSASVWGGTSLPILSGFSPPWEVALAMAMHLRFLTIDARVDYQRASLNGERLSARLQTVSIQAGARAAYDLGPVALSAGLRVGGAWIHQSFQTDRIAPARSRLVPMFLGVIRADFSIYDGWFLGLEGQLGTLYIRRSAGLSGDQASSQADTPLLGRLALGVGKQW